MQMQKQIRRAQARNDGRVTVIVKPKAFNPAMPPGIELVAVNMMSNGGLLVTTQRKGAQ